jgi:hypothetical protein
MMARTYGRPLRGTVAVIPGTRGFDAVCKYCDAPIHKADERQPWRHGTGYNECRKESR